MLKTQTAPRDVRENGTLRRVHTRHQLDPVTKQTNAAQLTGDNNFSPFVSSFCSFAIEKTNGTAENGQRHTPQDERKEFAWRTVAFAPPLCFG